MFFFYYCDLPKGTSQSESTSIASHFFTVNKQEINYVLINTLRC
jgi:hypothetical protein